MLKSIGYFLQNLLDLILPPRKDFVVVSKLKTEDIEKLPKPKNIDGMEWVYPLFHYKDSIVKSIIWELKYKNNTIPLDHIGQMLYEEIIQAISDIQIFDNNAQFVLIPIPITKERRIERGYNQSEYIAKAVLENDLEHILLYAPQWFSKTKDTPRQSHSESKEERRQNLKNCFSADPKVYGKYIILIDDVVTTGSTLSEARDTLLTAGAKDVLAFTIAH